MSDRHEYALKDNSLLFVDSVNFNKGSKGKIHNYNVSLEGKASLSFTLNPVSSNYNEYNFFINESQIGESLLKIINEDTSAHTLYYHYDATKNQTIVWLNFGVLNGATVRFIYTGNTLSLRDSLAHSMELPIGQGYGFQTIEQSDVWNFDENISDYLLQEGTFYINVSKLPTDGNHHDYFITQSDASSIDFTVWSYATAYTDTTFHVDYTGNGIPSLSFVNTSAIKKFTVSYGYDSSTDTATITVMAGIYRSTPIEFLYKGNVFHFTPDVVNERVMGKNTGFSPSDLTPTSETNFVMDRQDYTLENNASLFVDSKNFTEGPKGTVHDFNISVDGKSSLSFTISSVATNYNEYNFYIEESDAAQLSLNIVNDVKATHSIYYQYDAAKDQTVVWLYLGVLSGSTVRFIYSGNVFNLGDNPVNSTDLDIGQGFVFRTVIVCYLAGTLIATPDGERAIETLRVGDAVIAIRQGQEYIQTLRWAGQGHALVMQGAPDDSAGYPICIRANALQDGCPHQDLRVTSDHCIFMEGGFIPARMLVNGSSIFFDRSERRFAYYHLELDRRSVLRANGALSESYLDTGNRHDFQHSTSSVAEISQPNRQLSWERDAAAPLMTAPHRGEPIYRAIAERCGVELNAPTVNHEPALHLSLPDGAMLYPTQRAGGTYTFDILTGVKEVWVESRAARLCDVYGPF